MAARSVFLTQRQEELIAAVVEAGKYQSADAVLQDGLRLLKARERDSAARAKAFREEAQKGWGDLEAGRYTDLTAEELPGHIAELSARAARLVAEAG